jgi:hypothetical protein
MTKASDNLFPKVIMEEVANDGSATTTPSADHRAVFMGEDGALHAKDSAGAVTALGGDVSAHTGDTSDAHDASAISVLDTAANFTGTDVEAVLAELQDNIDGVSGGSSVGQAVSYPTSFNGTDTFDGSSTTPFADVDAFSTKEVLNSRILHLRTLGASQDDRVRVTPSTTRAGAFDIRTAFQCHFTRWGTNGDTYFEIRLSQSDDTQIAVVRYYGNFGGESAAICSMRWKLGTGAPPGAGSNMDPELPMGTPVTLRFTRDGSNLLKLDFGVGNLPLALGPAINGSHIADSATVSGTLARIEYSLHTPSGPGGTATYDAYIDYLLNL